MIEKTSDTGRIITFSFEDEPGGLKNSYCGVSLRHSLSNCKLSILDSVGTLTRTTGVSKELKIEAFKKIFQKCRIVVHLSVITKAEADFFTENFELYGFSKVPVGYGSDEAGKYQYHILIRNTMQSTSGYLRPTEFKMEEENKVVKVPVKRTIKKAITAAKPKKAAAAKIKK